MLWGSGGGACLAAPLLPEGETENATSDGSFHSKDGSASKDGLKEAEEDAASELEAPLPRHKGNLVTRKFTDAKVEAQFRLQLYRQSFGLHCVTLAACMLCEESF